LYYINSVFWDQLKGAKGCGTKDDDNRPAAKECVDYWSLVANEIKYKTHEDHEGEGPDHARWQFTHVQNKQNNYAKNHEISIWHFKNYAWWLGF
jgi:hypothetical protein